MMQNGFNFNKSLNQPLILENYNLLRLRLCRV